jgi:ADP-ribosylglycohydrolase
VQQIFSTIREAVPNAVNLGDDADTTGAVCGQLVGAYWGVTGISPELFMGFHITKPFYLGVCEVAHSE